MILECTSCHARFLVPDNAVPPGGRTVRCGKCAHEWHVEPVMEAEPLADVGMPSAEPEIPPAAVMPADATASVPAVKRRRLRAKPFKIAAPVLALVWILLAFVAYFPQWQTAPVLSGIYRTLGMQPTDGLVFADVHMEKSVGQGGKTQFILSGSIVNHAATVRTVPTVRVKLKTGDGKTAWSREYAVNVTLKAGEVYPFRIANVETSFAANVTSIVLDVGHALQLMMRS
ncbi:MAG: zinc-ribbon domain-containing protein [Rickettsiales bacterium]